jgi:hypothetical protein
MQLNYPYRATTRDYWEQYCKGLNIAIAKDIAMHKEPTETKWIQMAGKPNKDFLAKLKGACKRIGNMMIDNVKNKPDLPRTDNINAIVLNFVKYYTKLYEHKSVCPMALDKLITNLTLKLDDKEVERLEAPIKESKMLIVLVDTPKGKSPGMYQLPYKYYKGCPNEAAQILVDIDNMVAESSEQLMSWAQIVILVIPKELDLYFTHKFRPISHLNTDYKMVMKVWANRLGLILTNKIGHHQRGFILGRDGRENIINIQMIIDLPNAMNEEGAVTFLDQKGCPLSPLIYVVVVDLYNRAIINHKHFKGHETLMGHLSKSQHIQIIPQST